MATWVEPIDSQTDPDAPLTSELGKRWDYNVVAAFEGASGAPRLVYAPGSIGSLAFATYTGGATVAYGATVAGSSLFPVSAIYGFSGGAPTSSAAFTLGSALTGTWQCLGEFDASAPSGGAGETILGATLWQRVS